MKSVKMTYLSSCICGLLLFIIGIVLLINIKNAPGPINNDNITPSNNTNQFDIIDNYTVNKNPINFLVLIKEASGNNTDTIIIANYAPETRQINLLNIPRDTKAGNKDNTKINAIYNRGIRGSLNPSQEDKVEAIEYTTQTISNLTGIEINYYIYLEIDTIKEIVDKLGGIYFDIPARLRYEDPTQNLHIDLQKGYQLLNGDKAEQFLRFRQAHRRYYSSDEYKEVRKIYNGSDLVRTEMQIKFVNAIIDQKVNLLEIPKLIPVINFAFNNVVTNTELNNVLTLFSAFTQGSRPEMNTFKLYGIDKRIDDLAFIIYNNTIEDTKSKKILRADEVIENYFSVPVAKFIPDKNKKYDFSTAKGSNPSNSETDSVGDNSDKP